MHELCALLDEWRQTKDSELEVRFGTLGPNWRTGVVNKDVIKRQFDSFNGWARVETSQKEYLINGDVRVDMERMNVGVKKKRLRENVFRVEGTNVAFKLSLKTETIKQAAPTPGADYRCVQRTSYSYSDFLVYDVSTVMHMNHSGVQIQDEFEIEVLRDTNRSNDHVAVSLEAKIRDVVGFFGVPRDAKFNCVQ